VTPGRAPERTAPERRAKRDPAGSVPATAGAGVTAVLPPAGVAAG